MAIKTKEGLIAASKGKRERATRMWLHCST